jgi:hypothetical protein
MIDGWLKRILILLVFPLTLPITLLFLLGTVVALVIRLIGSAIAHPVVRVITATRKQAGVAKSAHRISQLEKELKEKIPSSQAKIKELSSQMSALEKELEDRVIETPVHSVMTNEVREIKEVLVLQNKKLSELYLESRLDRFWQSFMSACLDERYIDAMKCIRQPLEEMIDKMNVCNGKSKSVTPTGVKLNNCKKAIEDALGSKWYEQAKHCHHVSSFYSHNKASGKKFFVWGHELDDVFEVKHVVVMSSIESLAYLIAKYCSRYY